MKFLCTLILLLCFAAVGIAQQSDTGQPKLTVHSTLGVPFPCPPFPASCPVRFTMTPSALPPHRSHREGLPQRVPQAWLAAPCQECKIRGRISGCRRRIALNFSHVIPLPRVRRLSHFFQI